MFESLSDQIQDVLKGLRSEGRITEAHVDRSLREIRIALLEADVNFRVAKDFIARIRSQALGEKVLRSLTPGQQVIKIVRDELIKLLGGRSSPLDLGQVRSSTIMLVGLQGSGKTTSAGKLSVWLRSQGRRPLMVSTDVYRPAAIDQVKVIGEELNIPVFSSNSRDALELARKALAYYLKSDRDVLVVDTAGRLHIDEQLMSELQKLQDILTPSETMLVADAMMGQDAVTSVSQFDQQVELTGVMLTKLDGDARGGAALSIRTVTGKPIKFVGVGEKYDALEAFHPARMAGRILGMGDVLSFIEKAEQTVDEEQARDVIRKIQKNEFSLEDFLMQLRQLRKLGRLDQLLGLLPRAGPLKGLDKLQVDEKQLSHLEAIISSMTPQERLNYKMINGSRRKRIAQGCGRPVSEVNRLLKQYLLTRKLMKKASKGLFGKKLPNFSFPL